MPQLDVYRQQQTAQNELRVVRNAQPSAAAAEVVGETITAFGELGMRIQEARAEQEAANLEIEAGRRYDSLYRELEQDGEGSYEKFEERLTEGSSKLRGELLGKVKSKAVRDAFDLRLKGMESGYIVRTRDLMQRRGVEEVKAGLIGRMASLEDTANDMSVLFEETDPTKTETRTFTRERDVVMAEIRSMQAKGFIGKDDAAVYLQKVDDLAKKADSDRILNEIDTRLDAGESAAAEEYFKLNYGRILPEARERAESVLEAKSLEAKAIAKADELYATKDYGAAMAEAAKITNPDERLAVESRIAQLKNQGDAAKEAANQALLEEGMGYITKGQALPSDLLRRASPLVVDRLQTEQRTRRLWEQQMATLSAEEKAALREASSISKDYIKSLGAVDPEMYLAGPDMWSADILEDWNRMAPTDKSDVLSDIATKRAGGGTFDAADKVLKDLTAQVPMLGPSNMKAKDLRGESKSKGAALKEEQAVRASLYRQAQEYAKRTGGAPITPQESKVMIARAFREANSTRYPFEEPGAFMDRIAGRVASSPVYQTSRAYLKEKLGREPTDAEVVATMQALGEMQ